MDDRRKSTGKVPRPRGPPPSKRRFVDFDSRDFADDEIVSDFCDALAIGGPAEREYRTAARRYMWPQNIVTNVKLGTSVDLRNLSGGRSNFYVPQRFEACVGRMKMKDLMAVGLMFRTSSAVIVGTHSLAQTVKAAHTLRMHLMADSEPTTFESFKLSNMVYNTRVESRTGINVAAFNKKNAERTTYVPMMFPGLQYYAQIPATSADRETAKGDAARSTTTSARGRRKRPQRQQQQRKIAKMRVFDTGKLIIMGITKPSDLAPVVAEGNQIARDNPDEKLPPASGDRFDYRNEQKRKMFCEPSSAWTEVPGSSSDDDEDG